MIEKILEHSAVLLLKLCVGAGLCVIGVSAVFVCVGVGMLLADLFGKYLK